MYLGLIVKKGTPLMSAQVELTEVQIRVCVGVCGGVHICVYVGLCAHMCL